jgi:ribosomal protein L40E
MSILDQYQLCRRCKSHQDKDVIACRNCGASLLREESTADMLAELGAKYGF